MYNKIELGYNEGIEKIAQEIQEAKDAANIIIVVGGQGVKALCKLKEKVGDRVQCLAIDSDSFASMEMENNREFFYIGLCDVYSEFLDVERVKSQPYMEWLDFDQMKYVNPGQCGAGAIRSVGRYMFHKRADLLFERVNTMLECAGVGLKEGYCTNIYIITSLCGGTGSGCFLDLCYLIRHLLEERNQKNVCVQGYFLLSSILFNNPMFPKGGRQDNVLKQNDDVALKELDYLMTVADNGSCYEHQYTEDLKVIQNVPPVDVCNFLCKN